MTSTGAARNSSRILLAVAAAALIVLAAFFLYSIATGAGTVTTTRTITVPTTTTATYFFGNNVTMQVPNLASIPSAFVIGGYLLTDASNQPCSADQCQLSNSFLTFEVSGYCPPTIPGCPLIPPQNVTFSWPSNFSQNPPSPPNATLHGGALTIDWQSSGGSLQLTVVAYVHGSPSNTTQVYNVTFRQSGACSPSVYVTPWSITLGNMVEIEPSNASLSIPENGYSAGPELANLYTIVFSVPDGVYQYTVVPYIAFGSSSGTVIVNGSDIAITLEGPQVSCTTTIATSSGS